MEGLCVLDGSHLTGDICLERNGSNLATLVLQYSKAELTSYTQSRIAGLSKASIPWIKRCSLIVWGHTKGIVSKERCDALRRHLSVRYTDPYAPRKVLNFATAFLRYLATTRFDTRYQAFELFLEPPKALKERKRVTGRIVTTQDVRRVLATIQRDYEVRELNESQHYNFTGLVVFGAFTGQRPYATIRKLTVGQFRCALNEKAPVLEVLAEQDKIRMQHYVPLHPQVVEALSPLVEKRRDENAMFTHESFDDWLRDQKIPLSRVSAHFVGSDLRKFAEQHGDIIGWDHSNRAYILTHGVSGVDWSHYKHTLPDVRIKQALKHRRKIQELSGGVRCRAPFFFFLLLSTTITDPFLINPLRYDTIRALVPHYIVSIPFSFVNRMASRAVWRGARIFRGESASYTERPQILKKRKKRKG